MRRIARLLVRLYPAHWRVRYGDELEALLEDGPVSTAGLFDVVKGAVKMQLSVPSFPKLALLLSGFGIVAGLGISYLIPPTYISTAVLRMTPLRLPAPEHPTLREYLQTCQQDVMSRTSLYYVISDPRLDLYKNERAKMPMEDVIEQMRRDVKIVPVAIPSQFAMAFTIRFAYRDAAKAQKTVQVLLTRLQDVNLDRQRTTQNVQRARAADQIDRLEARIAALEKRLGMPLSTTHEDIQVVPAKTGFQLEVLDPPNLPERPVKPNRTIIAAFGFGCGIVLAGVIAVFRRRPPPIPFPAQPVV